MPLTLPHQASVAREDFLVAESNQAAFDMVVRWPGWPSKLLLLSGPGGSGKSHLVEIWCKISDAQVLSAADLANRDPIALAERGAIAIEDADRPGRDEAGLFHILNAARSAGASVLMTCRKPLEAWGIETPDLLSRLRAATPVVIGRPDDDLLKRVLVKLFADRQISVAPAVVDYLAVRMERSLAAAVELVAELDRTALSKGRPVTRAVAAEVLAAGGDRQGTDAVHPDR